MFRYLLCFCGFLLALPILVLIAMAFSLPISISGMGYLLGCLFIVAGLILAPRLRKYYLVLLAGLTIVFLIVGVRFFIIRQNTDSSLRMITLPQGDETPWIDTLIDEQDSLIFGEAFFHFIGGDSNREREGLASALLTAYSEMRNDGFFPSPIVSTYLNLQQPEHFDAVIIAPETKDTPKFGVVFLHGYMGNVTVQCRVIAQAVQKVGGVTICPSTDWRGDWWQPDGQAIIQTTFEYVEELGIQRFYLGGFSNGGFSISRLASQWKDENRLGGLIFIDGFSNGADIREVRLPVLILEGIDDERVPVSAARRFALEVGELGTYLELEGDHFLIIKNPAAVQGAITKWLDEREHVR